VAPGHRVRRAVSEQRSTDLDECEAESLAERMSAITLRGAAPEQGAARGQAAELGLPLANQGVHQHDRVKHLRILLDAQRMVRYG
jgi:hypothetical protein